jgi:hypothetical protein
MMPAIDDKLKIEPSPLARLGITGGVRVASVDSAKLTAREREGSAALERSGLGGRPGTAWSMPSSRRQITVAR